MATVDVMPFEMYLIDQAAGQIRQRLANGEIVEACCMSAMTTPVTESWEAARELAENADLSTRQQKILLQVLSPLVRKQLETTGFDDFDLIYERILQLVAVS